MKEIEELSKEELRGFLGDFAKNWLAHDGLWFLEVEKAHGTEEAIRLDREAWGRFAVVEAKRILERLALPKHGGIGALVQALRFRMYAFINEQSIEEVSPTRCVFRMRTCRVQDARRRKGLPDFPCKSVGVVEFSRFASTVDERIRTRCIACPPDPGPRDFSCGWEFVLSERSPQAISESHGRAGRK